MQQALVELKKPCYETLRNRNPGAKGNFCNTCQTVVIDFSDKTPDEISEYLSHHDVHCGTFNRKDISTGSRMEKLIFYLQSRHLKFAAVLLVSFVLLISCRTRRGKVSHGTTGFSNKNTSTEHLN